MPFIYTPKEELTINTNGIQKGDSFIVRDDLTIFPFELNIIGTTENSLHIREFKDGVYSEYWILRSDLQNHRELIDVKKD